MRNYLKYCIYYIAKSRREKRRWGDVISDNPEQVVPVLKAHWLAEPSVGPPLAPLSLQHPLCHPDVPVFATSGSWLAG